ncbi:MAG TPA: glycine oxidase ThiO, partial [Candidatus Baltobacteraceae bacterium]|nr:glycine oxidase ThiO [Candidatus Baltobacteraceae bacterium]
FELAERGAAVRVYDRAEPARAASWAGAGMLAPYTERIADGNMLALCIASLKEYPRFVDRVAGRSGIDPHLRLDGVFYAAFGEQELDALRAHAKVLHERGVAADLLDRAQALSSEPWLAASLSGGLVKQNEGHVDNRRLGRALSAACRSRGVRIERSETLAIECDGRRVLGVAVDRGFVAAGSVVNACGAWAGRLPGAPRDCVPPVVPIKGQMLALAAPAGFVRRATWVPGAYLVPRGDGRLLIGATVEAAGFDELVTAQGMHELLHAALNAAPSLGGFAVTEQWAGLRPGTPDELPVLGATPLEGFFLATGHYRNGILLAPATARLIADAVETGNDSGMVPFSLDRFGTEDSLPKRITHA